MVEDGAEVVEPTFAVVEVEELVSLVEVAVVSLKHLGLGLVEVDLAVEVFVAVSAD